MSLACVLCLVCRHEAASRLVFFFPFLCLRGQVLQFSSRSGPPLPPAPWYCRCWYRRYVRTISGIGSATSTQGVHECPGYTLQNHLQESNLIIITTEVDGRPGTIIRWVILSLCLFYFYVWFHELTHQRSVPYVDVCDCYAGSLVKFVVREPNEFYNRKTIFSYLLRKTVLTRIVSIRLSVPYEHNFNGGPSHNIAHATHASSVPYRETERINFNYWLTFLIIKKGLIFIIYIKIEKTSRVQ